MISYMDVMTLLVALMVLILVASGLTSLPLRSESTDMADMDSFMPPLALGVPLPSELVRAGVEHDPRRSTSALLPAAISAALGVSGLPQRVGPVPLHAQRDSGPISAWPPRQLGTDPSVSASLPVFEPLPGLALPSGIDTALPVSGYLRALEDDRPGNAPPLAAGETQAQSPTSSYEAFELLDLQGVVVSRVQEGIRLRVEDHLLFASAEAELTEEGMALVTDLLETIQRYAGRVSVEGHSDDRPISTPEFSSNWALSSARAIAIVHALEAAGVEPKRLQAVGLADTRPLADNANEDGRAMNRRVEVVIHAKEG
ncbi:chemotaxis protein MotB [Halomonas sp. A11-A]|nr:chemotaxis protein MotB [Halomonas sp. A11-A]